jgi:hypothetical protein
MEWVKWVIPLIALAVWILTSLIKSQQEEPRRRSTTRFPPQPQGGEEGTGPRPRRTSGEVEQFLEEIRRRRESGVKPAEVEQRPRPVVREAPPVIVVEAPRPRPAPRTPPALPPKRQPPRREEPATPRKRPAVTEEVVVARIVSTPPITVAAPPPPAASAITLAVSPTAPAARQFLDLLKNPQSMRVAFLMREILDRPVSRRPRRRV